MYTKMTIGGKEIELAANAATVIRYKHIFHKDLFFILGNEERAEKDGVEAIQELAFIMNKQAEKADMTKLDEEAYMKWLEQFPAMAFVEKAEDILNAYMESSITTATP